MRKNGEKETPVSFSPVCVRVGLEQQEDEVPVGKINEVEKPHRMAPLDQKSTILSTWSWDLVHAVFPVSPAKSHCAEVDLPRSAPCSLLCPQALACGGHSINIWRSTRVGQEGVRGKHG